MNHPHTIRRHLWDLAWLTTLAVTLAVIGAGLLSAKTLFPAVDTDAAAQQIITAATPPPPPPPGGKKILSVFEMMDPAPVFWLSPHEEAIADIEVCSIATAALFTLTAMIVIATLRICTPQAMGRRAPAAL